MISLNDLEKFVSFLKEKGITKFSDFSDISALYDEWKLTVK
jgi:hypothetical protein